MPNSSPIQASHFSIGQLLENIHQAQPSNLQLQPPPFRKAPSLPQLLLMAWAERSELAVLVSGTGKRMALVMCAQQLPKVMTSFFTQLEVATEIFKAWAWTE